MKKLLIVVLVLILACVAFVAGRPGRYHIERTVAVAAPPHAVYAELQDFHRWTAWSPWEGLDPKLQRRYSGADTGVGAVYEWQGDDKVGEGRMTITESRPHEFIRFKLEFVKPFASTCTTEFSFRPQGDQTLISWTMMGKNNFLSKAMGLCMNCDKIVGGQFDQGLVSMKTVAEAAARESVAEPQLSGKP